MPPVANAFMFTVLCVFEVCLRGKIQQSVFYVCASLYRAVSNGAMYNTCRNEVNQPFIFSCLGDFFQG